MTEVLAPAMKFNHFLPARTVVAVVVTIRFFDDL